MSTTVTVRCTGCKRTREIEPDEITDYDMPMCERCFGVMLPIMATSK